MVERVGAGREKRGVPRAQMALAWMLSKPCITSPIVGATKPKHLDGCGGGAGGEAVAGGDCFVGGAVRAASGGGVQLGQLIFWRLRPRVSA